VSRCGRAASAELADPGTQHTVANGKADHTVNVWVDAYPPCDRRRYWLYVTVSCPACGGIHAHRGGAGGGVRRSGCGKTSYHLTVRTVLGAAA